MKKDIYQLSCYKNKNCIYGIGIYNNKAIFYKTIYKDLDKELNGYKLVKKYYKVPEIYTYDNDLIIYEFNNSLIKKSLFDYLYINNDLKINYNLIFSQYKKSLKNIKYIEENDLINTHFYKERINLINELFKIEKNDKILTSLKRIKEVILEKKMLYSFISQGDPTDTNITIDGVFCDFENGGYNSLVGEIAIFIVSILTHGWRIYPKYNSTVYEIKEVDITNLTPSYKNIYLLINYLDFFKNNLDNEVIKELDKYLKYYICFRLLTPIKISIMSEDDKNYILSVLDSFYNTNSFDEIINLIKNWRY